MERKMTKKSLAADTFKSNVWLRKSFSCTVFKFCSRIGGFERAALTWSAFRAKLRLRMRSFFFAQKSGGFRAGGFGRNRRFPKPPLSKSIGFENPPHDQNTADISIRRIIKSASGLCGWRSLFLSVYCRWFWVIGVEMFAQFVWTI